MLILRGLQMGNFGQKTAKRGVGLQVLILQGLRMQKRRVEGGQTGIVWRKQGGGGGFAKPQTRLAQIYSYCQGKSVERDV